MNLQKKLRDCWYLITSTYLITRVGGLETLFHRKVGNHWQYFTAGLGGQRQYFQQVGELRDGLFQQVVR
jgi:hypothetical protein